MRIYTLDSIAPFVDDEKAMDRIVALIYFLCRQERSLMGLGSQGPMLKKIYGIAFDYFSKQVCEEEGTMDAIKEALDRTDTQFEKILQCANNMDPANLKKIIQYVKNGVEYTEKRRRLCDGRQQSVAVTPIEITISTDLHFVQSYRKQLVGKMKWRECYAKGVEDSPFGSYGSYLSFKDAYLKGRL